MKIKNLLLLFAVLAAFCVPVAVVSGQAAAVNIFSNCGANDPNYPPEVCDEVGKQQGNTGKNNPIVNIIKVAINTLSVIIGIASIITIVVSGIRMMTAGGSSEATASARSGLVYALVGIAVVVLAQALVAFVLDKVS